MSRARSIAGRQVHPAADLFPLMTGVEFDALVADITAYGLREPGYVDAEGLILDGRNRAAACEAAGVAMRWNTYTGDDPVAFVVSKNIHRRHLTPGQRAAIAAELATLRPGANQHPTEVPPIGGTSMTQAAAATALDVSTRQVQRAAQVKKADPALHAEVKSGRVTLADAVKTVTPTPTMENLDFFRTEPTATTDPPPDLQAEAKKPSRVVTPPDTEALPDIRTVAGVCEVLLAEHQQRNPQGWDMLYSSPPVVLASLAGTILKVSEELEKNLPQLVMPESISEEVRAAWLPRLERDFGYLQRMVAVLRGGTAGAMRPCAGCDAPTAAFLTTPATDVRCESCAMDDEDDGGDA